MGRRLRRGNDAADGTARVELAMPEDAIAPGQACVFYREGRVLGGGWIKASEPASIAAE